ncbi:MAG TPA: ATP-binding protein, partial [candidate division WOR-3 bacterium]|nr:ATP-binding protein [candidate division WOR-3 bacterium]
QGGGDKGEGVSAAVEVSVRDRGIGIRTEDLDKLFHRFQRVSRQDRPDIPGTGLGLAIVATIAREHGGGVSVESVHGKGSVFTIRLPRDGPQENPSLHNRQP